MSIMTLNVTTVSIMTINTSTISIRTISIIVKTVEKV
jgi:hypothetical protein